MRRILVTLLTVLALGGARRAQSQEVRGTVRESVSRQPIPGAVISLLDSAGRTLGRNITDERGQYRLAASPATTQLRFIRIGFRPLTVALARSGTGVDTVDVVMTTLPTMLDPMTVSANGCPRRDDAGAALGLLQQARASLLNSVVAREANPGRVVRLRFQRTMDGTSDRIARQVVRADSSDQSASPFSAVRSASEFVRAGFVKEEAGGSVFYAPDADALLDDAFMAGYCFRLVAPDRDHRTEVGLGFSAPNRARGRVDIDGVLWVDTTQRQLRRLEFLYVGLDRSLASADPGGRLSFHDMANGVIIIDRWSLRLPGVREDSTYDNRTQAYTRRRWLEVQETGGEVAHIEWPSGLAWDAPLGTLHLMLLTHAHTPAARTRVWLDGTSYEQRADANGEVTLGRLLPGPYELVVIDSLLEPLGITLRTPIAFVAVRDSTYRATLEVQTAHDYVADRCVHDRMWQNTMPRRRPDAVWMIGRVLGPDGTPFADARAVLDEGSEARRAQQAGANFTLGDDRRKLASTATGTDGIFELCQGRFLIGDSVIVALRHGDVLTNAFRFVLKDSLTVLPLLREAKRP